MIKSSHPPEEQHKGNTITRILDAFSERPKSRRMVAEEIGMNSGTLCWHVDQLIEANRLFLVKKTFCEVTGYPSVQYFSTHKGMRTSNTGNDE